MKIQDLTLQDIKEVSTNYLKSVIKNGASNPDENPNLDRDTAGLDWSQPPE